MKIINLILLALLYTMFAYITYIIIKKDINSIQQVNYSMLFFKIILQNNLLYFIMGIYYICNEEKNKNKILNLTIFSILYLILCFFNIWYLNYNDDIKILLLYGLSYITIFSFILSLLKIKIKCKKLLVQVLSLMILMLIIIFITYYQRISIVEHCKKIQSKEDTFTCINLLDYKYRNNKTYGIKNPIISEIAKKNIKFKNAVEKEQDGLFVINNQNLEWMYGYEIVFMLENTQINEKNIYTFNKYVSNKIKNNKKEIKDNYCIDKFYQNLNTEQKEILEIIVKKECQK